MTTPRVGEDRRLLNRGGWGNGDVYRVQIDGRPAVLKSYADKPAAVRLLGRWLLARERRAYRALAGVRGIPALLEHADPLGLALEFVTAEKIGNPLLAAHGPAIIASLDALIGRMHERGVYHLDLRNQGNILIDAEQQAYVVDFASALIVGPGPLGRMLARLLARVDRAALAKWAARVP